MSSSISTKQQHNAVNFDKYIKEFYSKKGEEKTHTRIASPDAGITGGAYFIPLENRKEFIAKYCKHVFVNRKEEYLTEIQLSEGPILIDIDERYDIKVEKRLHTKEDIERILSLYLSELQNLYDFDNNTQFNIYILEKKHLNKNDPKYSKDGIHIIIGIHADRIIQYMLRERVLKNIGEVLSHLPLKNSMDDVLDSNISRIVNPVPWQMYGSKKPGHEPYELTYHYVVKYCGKPTTSSKSVKKEKNKTFSDSDENNSDDYDSDNETYNESDKEDTQQHYEDNDESPWECDEKNIDYFDVMKDFELLSAHNTNNPTFPISENIKREYNDIKSNKPRKSPTSKFSGLKKKVQNTSYEINEIQNYEQLTYEVDRMLNELEPKDYEIRETHNYTMCLSEKYYNNYNEWIQVGWALKNTNEKLFLTWILFSSKSTKFSYNMIPEFYDKWCNFDNKKDGLTKRSIIYWAKVDSPHKYEDVYRKTVDYYINTTLSSDILNINGLPETTIVDLTTVLYQMFKGQFICASIRNNVWYEFSGNRWVESDCGISLKKLISNDLHNKYLERFKMVQSKQPTNLLNSHGQNKGQSSLNDDDDDTQSLSGKKNSKKQDKGSPTSLRISDICLKLRNPTVKQSIMKEAQEQFYDKEFIKKMDTKTHLLCFNNGIIDFEKKIFRKGQPDDYITKTTNIDYIKLDRKKHEKTIQEIDTFMEQLFPNSEVRRTMWEHLASCLIGVNYEQIMVIYNGSGSNGKSLLVKLMSMSLGEYKASVPISYVTQKRKAIGGPTSEIACLQGVRYAVMQEPSKGDTFNEGIIKEITGGDPIQGRALFKDQVTFDAQFKLVACTNIMPEIKSNDDGTWRRIVKVDFISKFCDNPKKDDPDQPYQFQIDRKLEEKFDKWVPVFMSMLVDLAFKTEGRIYKCKEIIDSSENYRNSQDYINEFIRDKIVKKEGGRVKKSELYETFKTWYQQNYDRNVPKGNEIYNVFDIKYGKYSSVGWKNISIVYDNSIIEEED